jgi:hypothetical protein
LVELLAVAEIFCGSPEGAAMHAFHPIPAPRLIRSNINNPRHIRFAAAGAFFRGRDISKSF